MKSLKIPNQRGNKKKNRGKSIENKMPEDKGQIK
jgi:hypothetical protein